MYIYRMVTVGKSTVQHLGRSKNNFCRTETANCKLVQQLCRSMTDNRGMLLCELLARTKQAFHFGYMLTCVCVHRMTVSFYPVISLSNGKKAMESLR